MSSREQPLGAFTEQPYRRTIFSIIRDQLQSRAHARIERTICPSPITNGQFALKLAVRCARLIARIYDKRATCAKRWGKFGLKLGQSRINLPTSSL